MPVLEDVKKVAEKMTGWSRRSGDELTGLVRKRKTNARSHGKVVEAAYENRSNDMNNLYRRTAHYVDRSSRGRVRPI
jgi:hypothetical protein